MQEDSLHAGASNPFREEPREAWGRLGSEADSEAVPTEPGRYVQFYERIRAIRERERPPVPLSAGIETLCVIEAARRSSAERAVVLL